MSDGRTSNQGGGGGGGGGISGSGSAGQVSFFDSSTSITSSPNLTFDGSNDFRVAGKNPYYIGGSSVVAIADGGTSASTANAAFNNLAPSQTGNAGKILTTDGTNTSWTTSGTYTDEQAQDAVGSILTDTSTIDFTYDDAANQITAVIAVNSITNSLISPTAAIDATKIANGSVSSTEFQYLDGVTSALQTQLNSKINLTEKAAASGVATLDGTTRIPLAQIPTSVLINAGTWNATTNTPTLANGTGVSGYFYVVSVAGTVNFGAGNITFAVGDWVYYNGSIWQKSINSNLVNSVNGQQGTVVLTTSDISEGSNLYYTDERAQDAVGGILADTATIAFTYNDSGNVISANVIDSSITFSKIQNIATGSLLGRNTAGTGVVEVLTTIPTAVQGNITQLGTISSGTWNGTTIGSTFGGTGFSTYTLGDILYSSATNTLSKLAGNTTTTRQFLRQVGNGTVSAAPAWDTVTKTDVGLSNVENTALSTWAGSTNLTTLGTITTGVWNGSVIPLAFGGTNANLTASNGGIFYSTATAGAILAGVATAGRLLQSGATAAPTWSTSTYPSTAGSAGQIIISNGTNFIGSTALYPNTTTINQLLYSSSANTIVGLATANSGTLVTDSGGVPSISSTLPNAVQDNITRLGTITVGTWNGTAIGVTFGGTGLSSIAQGDILYGSATNILTALAKDTNATRYLSNTGTTNNPAWSQINLANGVTGTLPFGNGGTGFSSYTDGQLLIGNTGTGGLSRATLTAGSNITITNGSGTITIAATGSTGYSTVQEEGSNLTQRATLNFIGSAITASDNAGSTRTDITIDSTVNALASLSTTGLISRTGSGTLATRTITAGSANLTVSNGDGVSGNPTIDIGSSVVTLTGTQSLSNKTLDNTTILTITDNNLTLQDDADNTKQLIFQLSGIATGTTRTLTAPNASGTIALTSDLHAAVTLAGENYLSLSGQQITAAAVNLSGTNATGTLAAGRFPALTGDVTTSAGSLATTIANGAVTIAKTTGIAASGANTDITSVLLNQTGLVVKGATANALTIRPNETLTAARTLNIVTGDTTRTLTFTADATIGGTVSGTNTGDQTITLTGDVTGSGTGSFAATIAANAVSNAKFRQGIARSVVGVTGNATANVADIQGTTDQVLRIDSAGTGLSFGAIDISKTAAVTGVLQAASFPALTGDVTTSAGSLATTLATVVATKGGTGQTSYAVGDLLYASTTTALSKLADVAAGSYLRSGGVSTAPVWSTTTLPNSATTGDLIYASASNVYSNLAGVATGNALISGGVGTAPSWGKIGLTTHVTGTLAVTNGGLGIATVAQGDLLYGSATNTISALAKDTNATRYLSNTGTTNNPAWAQIDLTNGVTGILTSVNGGTGNGFTKFSGPATTEKTFTLPNSSATILTDAAAVTAAQGGTGQTSYAVGDLLYASASNALSKLADVAAGSYLRSGGVTTAPVWSTTTLPNSATTGDLLYASASNVYSNLAAVATGKELRSAGTGTAPTWSTAGGSVITFFLNTGQNFVANGYIGLGGDGSSTLNVNIVPWVVPVAGTISFLRVFGFSNAPSNLHVLIYKASNATSPTYSATTLDATVSSGTNSGSDTTHTVSVSAGDLLVAFCNTSWSTFGACINVMFLPT